MLVSNPSAYRSIFWLYGVVLALSSHANGGVWPLNTCPEVRAKCDSALCPGGHISISSKDTAWHDLAQCMREIRNLWSRRSPEYPIAIDDQRNTVPLSLLTHKLIRHEMQSSQVWFVVVTNAGNSKLKMTEIFNDQGELIKPFDFIVVLNSAGQPYNSMGQSGLAYFLFQLASLAAKGGYAGSDRDALFYRTLAKGVIRAVITPVEKGGLASRRSCRSQSDSCVWFHSITRRDKRTVEGATLNQNLHAIRDIGMIIDLFASKGWDEELRLDLEHAFREGVRQLFEQATYEFPGELPTLLDFVSPTVRKDKTSWIYYGFNLTAPPEKAGYFLRDGGKDCHYNNHVLELLAQILERAKRTNSFIESHFALSCNSPVATMYRVTKSRLDEPNTVNIPTRQFQLDTSCSPDSVRAFRKADQAFYSRTFSQCFNLGNPSAGKDQFR
jgi:hypothetical protein